MTKEDLTAGPQAPAAEPRERFQQAASEKQSNPDEPENELWEGSYSHLAMVGSWITAGVLSVVGLVVAVLLNQPAVWMALLGIVAVIWLGLAGLYFYRRFSVSYRLTSQRLIHEAGLLWRVVDRVELIDVDDVTYRQGPIERLLGVGTILITSSDRTTPELELPGIEEAREVADTIDDARRKERRSRGLHIEAV